MTEQTNSAWRKRQDRGGQIKVYILCRHYLDTKMNVMSKRIVKVFADAQDAYAELDKKTAKNDHGWYIVAKELKEPSHG